MAVNRILYLKSKNQPQRKYLRKDVQSLDKFVQVQSTLLEYGQQNILLANLAGGGDNATGKNAESKNEKAINIEEEKRLKKLMNEMSETDKKQVNYNF